MNLFHQVELVLVIVGSVKMIKVFCVNNWKDKKHKNKKSEIINLTKKILDGRHVFTGNCKVCNQETLVYLMVHPSSVKPSDITVKNHDNPLLEYRACNIMDSKWGLM